MTTVLRPWTGELRYLIPHRAARIDWQYLTTKCLVLCYVWFQSCSASENHLQSVTKHEPRNAIVEGITYIQYVTWNTFCSASNTSTKLCKRCLKLIDRTVHVSKAELQWHQALKWNKWEHRSGLISCLTFNLQTCICCKGALAFLRATLVSQYCVTGSASSKHS